MTLQEKEKIKRIFMREHKKLMLSLDELEDTVDYWNSEYHSHGWYHRTPPEAGYKFAHAKMTLKKAISQGEMSINDSVIYQLWKQGAPIDDSRIKEMQDLYQEVERELRGWKIASFPQKEEIKQRVKDLAIHQAEIALKTCRQLSTNPNTKTRLDGIDTFLARLRTETPKDTEEERRRNSALLGMMGSVHEAWEHEINNSAFKKALYKLDQAIEGCLKFMGYVSFASKTEEFRSAIQKAVELNQSSESKPPQP